MSTSRKSSVRARQGRELGEGCPAAWQRSAMMVVTAGRKASGRPSYWIGAASGKGSVAWARGAREGRRGEIYRANLERPLDM